MSLSGSILKQLAYNETMTVQELVSVHLATAPANRTIAAIKLLEWAGDIVVAKQSDKSLSTHYRLA